MFRCGGGASDTKSKICDRSSNSPFVQTKIIEVLKRYWPKNDENHLIIISLFKQKHLTLRSILPLVGNVYWRDFPVKLFQHPQASRWQGNLAEYFSSGTWPSISVGQPDQGHMYQLGNLTKHLSWATWLGFSGFCGALQERHSGLHVHLSTSYHH